MEYDLSLGVPELSATETLQGALRSPRADSKQFLCYPSALSDVEVEAVRTRLARVLPNLDPNALSFSVHHGGRGALYDILCALAQVSPGLQIAWRAPYWFGYSEIAGAARIPVSDGDREWSHRGKAVALACFPNNPDGRDDSDWLMAAHENIDYLIIDLVYLTLLPSEQAPQINRLVDRFREKAVIVLSTSKTCAMPGLRVGYTASLSSNLRDLIQEHQQCRSNFPSTYNRALSAHLWANQELVDSISAHYARLRTSAAGSLADYDLAHRIVGMFLWIDTPGQPAAELLRFVKENCGYIGSDGRRFGAPTGSRWTLRRGVDYAVIGRFISEFIAI